MRNKYGANDIRPGLGWAQISGIDECPIDIKVNLDGEHAHKMSFKMDVKCFFRTSVSVFKHDGIVEGGTGNLERKSVKQ